MSRNLTMTPGNPAFGLRIAYNQLTAITEPQELHDAAIEIVFPYSYNGMSQNHFASFKSVLAQKLTGRNPLFALQKFIADFMLKADGDGVIGGYRR